MSLKARIRGLEAKVEWLEMWGELRKIELQFKLQQKKREIADRLAADPKAAALFAAAGMSIRPTPRPAPPPPPLSPVDSAEDDSLPRRGRCPQGGGGLGVHHVRDFCVERPSPPPALRATSPCGGGNPEQQKPNAIDAKTICVTNTESPSALRAPPPAGEEIVRPPPPVSPPEPEPWTHDPPEHLQIEKVTWRFRTLQDDLDDEEEEEDEYYDPLRDPSWAL